MKIIHNDNNYIIEEEILPYQLIQKKKNNLNKINLKDLFLEEDFELYLKFLENFSILILNNKIKILKEIINFYGPKNYLKILEKKKLFEFNHFIFFNNIKYPINYQIMCLYSKKFENLFLNNSNEIFHFNYSIENKYFEEFLIFLHNEPKNQLFENNIYLFELIIYFECENLEKNFKNNKNKLIIFLYLNENNINKNEFENQILNNFLEIIKEKYFFKLSFY